MAKTVVIRCPQGIQRLCELGETVAASGNWDHPLAREALIGFWLSCVLTRANLRGSLEVTAADGARVQVSLENAPIGDDAIAADRALSDVWRQLDAQALAEGANDTDDVSIDVALPQEAGALPAIVVGAVILGGSVAFGWIGSSWVKQAGFTVREWLQRRAGTEANLADAAIVDRETERAMASQGGVFTPVQSAMVAAANARIAQRAANMTAPLASPDNDGFSLGKVLTVGGLILLGAAWLGRQKG